MFAKRLQCRVGSLSVYTVDGPKIRDRKSVEFAAGGHGYVYSYVPKNHIWIERINTRRDQRMVLAHELIERECMKHLGWSYKRAHALANELEDCLRHGSRAADTFFFFLNEAGCFRTQAARMAKARELAHILRMY